MRAYGHASVWRMEISVGRANDDKGWYQQIRDRWTAHKAARQQANFDALHRCWDAQREAVTPFRAKAAPEMAAAQRALSVAPLLYGLAV
jgi:hypothetical protein